VIDVARVRAETPATAERVFLNHAGASPSPDPVLEVVIGHLRDEARVGGYEAAEMSREELTATRRSIARLVGCDPDGVALMTSATDAWESAFWSMTWKPGDVVLTCRSEYVTNVVNLLVARERFGVDVRVVDDDEHGQIDLASLERHLDTAEVRLMALSHVPTHGGLVNPAAEVGARCRSAGVTFLLDACQSVGQLPLDLSQLGCDVLTATGRKFLRAPRGSGFMACRSDFAEQARPLGSAGAVWTTADSFDLPTGAARFERYERSVAAALGLGVAVDYALGLGLEEIARRIDLLATHLRSHLDEIPSVTVRDLGEHRCGIVTFTVDGVDPDLIRSELDTENISVWTSGAPLARIDLDARGIDAVVRASVHYLNTLDELDRTIESVERIVAGR